MRVRFLRRAIIIASASGTGLLMIFVLFDPFGKMLPNFSMGQISIDGTRVRMEAPKISGFRKDGLPYEVKASAGLQDIAKPSIIELERINAKVGMADSTTALISAGTGVYDSGRDFMSLAGNVRIKNSSGYDARLKSATMSFKTGIFVSDDEVDVRVDSGTITAKRMEISEGGHKISFEGDIRSVFDEGAKEPQELQK
jgi:lipopolysaccharide export system protein LptC